MTVSLVKIPAETEMWVEITPDGRRFLRFGRKPCSSCVTRNTMYGLPPGREVAFGFRACDKCKGTGKRGNGRCRACKVETWEMVRGTNATREGRTPGMVRDYDSPRDGGECHGCAGTGVQDAGWGDYVPKSLLPLLAELVPVRVYPADRRLSAGESLLGMIPGGQSAWGGVWGMGSVSDYGRGWEAYAVDSAAFAAKVAEDVFSSSHQACSFIVRESGELVDHLAILLGRDGYSRQGIAPDIADRTGRRVHVSAE